MATSGSTDFSVTRNNIVRDAYLLLGTIDADEILPAELLADGSRMLNMMVKHWQIHTRLWPTKDVTVTLTAGTESYTVGSGQTVDTPRPLRITYARRRDSSNNEIPVDVVSRQTYMDLPVKSTEAPATMVYYDPQLSTGTLYVWPTGTTDNTTLIITVQRPLEDFDAAANTPDFPQEWYLAIVYNLAVKLGPQIDTQVPQDVRFEAERLFSELMQWDEESTSVFLQPSYRGR